MSYVDAIISRFGGTRPAARQLERKPSTVQSWKDSGVIPAKHQKHVLATARRLGLELSERDFFEINNSADGRIVTAPAGGAGTASGHPPRRSSGADKNGGTSHAAVGDGASGLPTRSAIAILKPRKKVALPIVIARNRKAARSRRRKARAQ